MSPLFAWLAAVNVLAFVLFGLDKWFAVRGMWRISERTLFTVALLGGTAGALLGMSAFRHKTRHWYFWARSTVVPCSAVRSPPS